MSLTYQQRKALKKLKVRLYRRDIRRFKKEELQREFAATSSGRVIVTRLIRCLVYQASVWIQRGKAPPIEGNLRSMFYQWIKPPIARLGLTLRSDPYDEMLDALETFVVRLKLFRYRDLDLIDEDWENRWFTDGRNPHLLLFAEKTGWIRFLQEMSRQYGLTSLALGGFAGHLSVEYLVEQLKTHVEELEPLVVFGITDYDPSGFFIHRSFLDLLSQQGVQIARQEDLIRPWSFTQEEAEFFSFPVPSGYPTRVKNWMDETNGLNGQPLGLEADSIPKNRLRGIIAERLQPYLRS